MDGCAIADFFELADQLPEVTRVDNGRYCRIAVSVQFTAGGFGWVVVRLAGVERDELAELTFEAWRLTAPAVLVDKRSDRLPR